MRKAGSKATPWSVKGIDDATRAVAREAAQEAGLTLGAWIDRAILKHAGIIPAAANDVSESGGHAGSSPGLDPERLETEVAAAEGRIEGHLRPVGLAVARVAQRMVQLERGLKSLPPDWPSTLTVPDTPPGIAPDPSPPSGEDHVAGGIADGVLEDEIVFAVPEEGEKPDSSDAEWEARWDRFKAELAEESQGAVTLEAAGEERAPPAPAAPERPPARRHFPGKLIVGGFVLVIGVGSGIGLMSQSERLGMKPALQRAADEVIGLGENIGDVLRGGTRWIEDMAWTLRGGRDSPAAGVLPPPAAADAAATTSPVGPPPAPNESAQASAPAPKSDSAADSAQAPLPVAPGATPAPVASKGASAGASGGEPRPTAGAEVAALPDARDSDTRPKTPPAGFAGIVEQRARQGDPEAQHDLAILYATGEGRVQDMREAAYWFREAAIQGIPGAQYNLGVLYEKGTGVQQDDVRALLWYHSAAERNHPRAQYNLGLFYAQGRGIPVNYAEARKWLRRAGDQGMTSALYELGQMEERGLGDAPDMSKARALYAQAAALGDQAAAERLVAMPQGNSALPADAAGSAKREDVTAPALPLSPEAERETIRAVQQILIRLGHDIGAADGLLGDRTRDGIRAYQRRHDLPVNGAPSAVLLQHMLQTMGTDTAAGASTGRAVSR